MAENNDGDSGQKGAPARSGPATGAGAVKVGVYEQPARPAQSPLMKWLPIILGLIALAFFAYRYLGARPATTTNDTANPPAAATATTTRSNDSASPGGSGGSAGPAATANPPGPAGAARP